MSTPIIDTRPIRTRTAHSLRARLAVATTTALIVGSSQITLAGSADQTLGLGTYRIVPKGGYFGAAEQPPLAPHRAGPAAAAAAPTNQWYSSVLFEDQSHPIHALPLTYRATSAGFEIGMPTRQVIGVDAMHREVRYPHVAALTVSPNFHATSTSLVHSSDWLAQINLAASATQSLMMTVLHGSPFSYYQCSGDVSIHTAGKPDHVIDTASLPDATTVAAFSLGGHSYAAFAPHGAHWEWAQGNELVLHASPSSCFFSVAGLPDGNADTVLDFQRLAYAFPTDTRAQWQFDQAHSRVSTTFTVSTTAMQGSNHDTFMGLYPHHVHGMGTTSLTRYAYDSVRGPIRLLEGTHFTVEQTYHGIVPYWGKLEDASDRTHVDALLNGDRAKMHMLFTKQQGRGTYWTGKGLGATAQLMGVAQAEGKSTIAEALQKSIEHHLEFWFKGTVGGPFFLQDARIGTFVGIPQEYASVSAMNDHHFHYGYWITAAAHVALRDPSWAATDHWGGMVKKIIADIATDEHGRADFPFLRNFDVYEGHSWASGDGAFDDGNNQESSSEAVNAWAGLILWAEATGDTRLRDLGIFLYTSEIASINQYWFDLNHEVMAKDFDRPLASMIFGGKYAYNTWWTEEPRQILGINAMPLTPASTYLATDPAYVQKLFADLPTRVSTYRHRGISDGTPSDIWQDVLASYLALGDPAAGLSRWEKEGTVESGETRTHTLFWLLSLKEMGTPDFSTTADTTLFQVFKNAAGRKTYLAYNAGTTPLTVKFSDGKSVVVAPRSLAQVH